MMSFKGEIAYDQKVHLFPSLNHPLFYHKKYPRKSQKMNATDQVEDWTSSEDQDDDDLEVDTAAMDVDPADSPSTTAPSNAETTTAVQAQPAKKITLEQAKYEFISQPYDFEAGLTYWRMLVQRYSPTELKNVREQMHRRFALTPGSCTTTRGHMILT